MPSWDIPYHSVQAVASTPLLIVNITVLSTSQMRRDSETGAASSHR